MVAGERHVARSKSSQSSTHLGFAQWGGGGGLRGPQGSLLQNRKLFGLGQYCLGGTPFYDKKNRKNTKKKMIWVPTQIATGDPVISKFEPHGLQRSPKCPICSSSGVLCSSRGPMVSKGAVLALDLGSPLTFDLGPLPAPWGSTGY